MTPKKLIGILGIAAVIAGAGVYLASQAKHTQNTDELDFVSNPEDYVDNRLEKPLNIDQNVSFMPIEVPSFELIDFNEKPFKKEDMAGTYSLVYFGFVNCPDVCINSTDGLNQAYEMLTDAERAKVRVYYFSFDTDRDTPEKLKEYLSAFNEEFIGISGHGIYKQTMGKVMHSFDIIADKKKSKNTYAFTHSNHSYMLDENANFLTHYNYQTVTEHPEKIVEDLRHIWAQKVKESPVKGG